MGALVMVAGAGSGKTTALRQALGTRRAAWVPCGDGEREGGRLLARVIDAIGRRWPGAAGELAERLTATGGAVDAVQAARDLVAELDELLVEPVVLVLDDAERLAGSPEALAVTGALLDGVGGGLRVALCSRVRLPLRLARVRAAGRLSELGAGDLAFDAAACAAVLRARTAAEPAQEDVERLLEATEGWALGIALWPLDGTPAPGASRSREELFAFLAEEVLDALSPEVREHVLAAALPRELDAELAVALGLPPRSPDRLGDLGLFLRATAPGAGRAAFHPLFRRLLLRRAESELAPERLAALHAAVADVLEARGEHGDAVEHRLAAGDGAGAARALVDAGPALLRTAPETVRGWIGRLPAADRDRPEVALLEGRIAWGAGRYAEACEVLDGAVEGLAAAGDHEREWTARFLATDALYCRGDIEEVARLAERLERGEGMTRPAVLPPAAARIAAEVQVLVASALTQLARFAEAERVIAAILEGPAGPAWQPLEPGWRAFFADLPRGRLEGVAEVRAAVAHLERDDPFVRLPYVLGALATLHEARGEHGEMLAAMDAAEQAARRCGLDGHVGALLRLHKAGIDARRGRLHEAEARLAALDVDHGWYGYDASITRATVAAGRGDVPAALDQAERALREARHGPVPVRLRAAALVAPVLLAAGQPARARAVLDEAIDGVPAEVGTAAPRAVRAWLSLVCGDEAAAAREVAEAWAEAGEGARHLVRAGGALLTPVLDAALRHGTLDPEPVAGALAAARPGGAAVVSLAGHAEPAVRRAIAAPLAAAGSPDAEDALRALAADADETVASAARAAARRLAEHPPPLTVRVLGPFGVRRGGWTVDAGAWGRPMVARLVRLLVVRRAEPVSEDELLEAFWPGRPTGAARKSLQVTVSRARHVVGPARLLHADRSYRLGLLPGDHVDADAFEAAARTALRAPAAERLARLEHAASLYAGEPLPEERYTEWALAWREALRDRQAAVLTALAGARQAAGDLHGAVDAARRLVELDPLDEGAHRTLIVAFARAGRRGQALRQCLACRRALLDELGVEPAADTARLHARVLAGDPV